MKLMKRPVAGRDFEPEFSVCNFQESCQGYLLPDVHTGPEQKIYVEIVILISNSVPICKMDSSFYLKSCSFHTFLLDYFIDLSPGLVCVSALSQQKHRHQSFIKMHEVFLPHQNQNSLISVSIYTEPIKGRKYILIRIRFLFRIFKSSMNKIAIYIKIRIIKFFTSYKSCQALDKYLFIPLSIPRDYWHPLTRCSCSVFFVSMLTVRGKTLRWIDPK